MKVQALNKLVENHDSTPLMPVLFVGHGNPMNAIEDNAFTREMKIVGAKLPKPKAILMVSAHWETKGTFVTAQEKPPTIHDFGGFPKALYDIQYRASGNPDLAEQTTQLITKSHVSLDDTWGYDHGAWSVAINLFPHADIPMIQLSLDKTKPASYHYELAKELYALRSKGVLIIGSGNMVHNFQYAQVNGRHFNAPFGHDWALEANETFKKLILENDYKSLTNYTSLGKPVQLAIPTPEHYLPMIYSLALKNKKEEVTFFNDSAVAGSFTMTSFILQ